MYNPYLIVPLAVWAITQLTKFTVAAFKGRLDIRYLYASGGMPSVHSAVVVSLATTAFLVDGPTSHLFGFTVIFAGVVIYDSFGVRRSSGEQAAALNMVISSLNTNRVHLDQPNVRLREIMGHKPNEVMVGSIMGLLLGCLFNYTYLDNFWTFLGTIPSRPEALVYGVICLLIGLAAVILGIIWQRRSRKSAAWRAIVRRLAVFGPAVIALTLVLGFAQYEKAAYLSGRGWLLGLMIATLLVAAWIAYWAIKTLPPRLQQEADRSRKAKWLEPEGKKRKKRR